MTETWVLSEIVVDTIVQLIIGAALGTALLQTDASWIRFLSGTGAIMLSFLAGAELDPAVFKTRWKEASAVDLVGFFAPFLGCPVIAYYGLHGPHVKLIAVREGMENGGA